MIRYLSGNIFDSATADIFSEYYAQTLVNPVNLDGVMGKGLALEFKKRYLEAYDRYRTLCQENMFPLGSLLLYRNKNFGEPWILMFPTKVHWREPSKLEYIEIGLKKFAETYEAKGITSIAFPMLGCGNGGLAWKDVCPLMERYLNPLPIDVLIYGPDL